MALRGLSFAWAKKVVPRESSRPLGEGYFYCHSWINEVRKMEYDKTLNLPKTDFPMRGNLPQREPEILEFWEKIDIYHKVQENNQGKPKFILHDGPPYANGDIHLGTAFNKILKDMIIKYYSMAGYDAPYIPGWDTHGLPIEQQAIKNLGLKRHEVHPVDFRKQCAAYAMKYVEVQKQQFKRLGVRGKWSDPYLTLTPEYEALQIRVFGEMAKKGFIYRGLKPVYWCSDCQTALAEAEVDYADKSSASIYVKFPVVDGKGVLPEEETFVVIWTTTPWTIPANVAICLHPDYDYVLADTDQGKLLLAKELQEQVAEATGLAVKGIIKEFKGEELERVVCRHPLLERDSLVILGDHVTLEAGTGCVHTAPGHGVEDYEVGRRYDLPIISPVNNKGIFTEEAGPFAGLNTNQCNKAVIEALAQSGALLYQGTIKHQYPHCWRCKHPIMFRATEQWFASIEGFREAALKAIREVKWIPAWGEERIYNMVADRSDWCISRQRIWGVPIPIFYCEDCGEAIITDETLKHVEDLFREHGSNIWFAKEAGELVPEGLKCPKCQGTSFAKETDTMDVWFDSGSSHAAVLEVWPELHWPADMYLEGSDQHRGWFNSSLSTAVATRGKAPYRSVLTHGYVVDEKGRKMSKSLGNGIDPLDVIKQMGADILRLWVASADYRKDIAVSPGILKQMTEAYRKIRNTCRFILGNLADFHWEIHQVPYEEMSELDRWALLRLHKLIQRVLKAYGEYEFHTVYHSIHNFCAVDMSALYLDICKDRLYVLAAGDPSRRAAQTVLYETINALVRLLTPILAFTTEEIWQYIPKPADAPVSVQLTSMPEVKQEYLDEELENKWNKLLAVRGEVAKALEEARKAKQIGNSLEAEVDLFLSKDWSDFLLPLQKDLPTVFIVSAVNIHGQDEAVPEGTFISEELEGLKVKVVPSTSGKCERCWNYSDTVGTVSEHPTICSRCAEVLKQIG